MNWLDLLITVCLGIGLVKGLFDGLIKQVVSLLSLVVAIFFAGRLAGPMRTVLMKQEWLTEMITPSVLTGFCYVLAFVVIVIGIFWLGRLLNLAINMTIAKPLNYLVGGFFGLIVWMLMLSLFFNLLSVFDADSTLISKQTQQESVLYDRVKAAAPAAYPYLKQYFKI